MTYYCITLFVDSERRRIVAKQTALKRKQDENARKVESVGVAVITSDTYLMIDESKGCKKKSKHWLFIIMC